jgi:hypothetical protein
MKYIYKSLIKGATTGVVYGYTHGWKANFVIRPLGMNAVGMVPSVIVAGLLGAGVSVATHGINEAILPHMSHEFNKYKNTETAVVSLASAGAGLPLGFWALNPVSVKVDDSWQRLSVLGIVGDILGTVIADVLYNEQSGL